MNSLKEKKSGIVSQNENIRRDSVLYGCFATLPFGVMVIGILIKEKEREESRYNEKRCFK